MDKSGQVAGSYAYDVFGSLRFKSGGAGNNYLFTGRPLDDETGLYYYRNRYYNPVIGRFVTKDPIGLNGGANRYVYVSNNPVNYIDPLGLFRFSWCKTTCWAVYFAEMALTGPWGPTPLDAGFAQSAWTRLQTCLARCRDDNNEDCDDSYYDPPIPGIPDWYSPPRPIAANYKEGGQ